MTLQDAGEGLHLSQLRAVEVSQLGKTCVLHQYRMALAHDQAVAARVLGVVLVDFHRMKIEGGHHIGDGGASTKVPHLSRGYHLQDVGANLNRLAFQFPHESF
ncbi:hypothetical protein SDC9_200361 [bioreactor metagenome]|uniref:Uncharacterized protein n=1 Tax=bioreactor metagenome TaxID=1076179 RepID=A0A645IQT9_9ZZZZ